MQPTAHQLAPCNWSQAHFPWPLEWAQDRYMVTTGDNKDVQIIDIHQQPDLFDVFNKTMVYLGDGMGPVQDKKWSLLSFFKDTVYIFKVSVSRSPQDVS